MIDARRIGVLGSGDVGRALASGFARHGWDVKLGTRSPGKLEAWLETTEGTVSVGSFAEAADHGGVLVLAVLGEAAEDVVDLAGPEAFDGKLVLDTTNPLDFSQGMPPHLLDLDGWSLAEILQAKLPGARIVKCFNTVSNAQMIDPSFEEGTPPMMICGDDAEAKQQAEAILVEMGWPGALDVGDITSARYLEALVPLWVRVGAVLDTWDHAFQPVT